jgi:hypothetical protein
MLRDEVGAWFGSFARYKGKGGARTTASGWK